MLFSWERQFALFMEKKSSIQSLKISLFMLKFLVKPPAQRLVPSFYSVFKWNSYSWPPMGGTIYPQSKYVFCHSYPAFSYYFHIISISVLCRSSCIKTLLRIFRHIVGDHWANILSSCFQKYHNNFLMKYRNSIEFMSLKRNYIIKMSLMTYLLQKEHQSLFLKTYHYISLVAGFPRSNWITRKICCI